VEEPFQLCTLEELTIAASKLLKDGLVAFPTETVYGLGADACNPLSVSRIYAVKGRPTDHPLIVHIPSIKELDFWAEEIPDYAWALAQDFWPGPLTLILKRAKLAPSFVTGGQETIGLRIPDHPVALALLKAFVKLGGKGIAAPSANLFGKVSPTTYEHVTSDIEPFLDGRDLILNGGKCAVGIESTIINCTTDEPEVLRPGFITPEMIFQTTRANPKLTYLHKLPTLRVSGSFAAHYSPKAAILLNGPPIFGQGFIALSEIPTPEGVIRLAAPSNLEEFAQILYSAFRKGDELGLSVIVVKGPDGHSGLGLALADRLKRAASSPSESISSPNWDPLTIPHERS
jgi:L-threonylcarbamoyladenylate synthase